MSFSLTLGAINLNDGTTYEVLGDGGLTMGNQQKDWDEVPSYATATYNTQLNVRTKDLVEVVIPMRVYASSEANLKTALANLWTEVDKSSNTLTLNIDGTTTAYTIVESTRPVVPIDHAYVLKHRASFTLTLMRRP